MQYRTLTFKHTYTEIAVLLHKANEHVSENVLFIVELIELE